MKIIHYYEYYEIIICTRMTISEHAIQVMYKCSLVRVSYLIDNRSVFLIEKSTKIFGTRDKFRGSILTNNNTFYKTFYTCYKNFYNFQMFSKFEYE